jgi:hypothetical protein
MVALIAVAAFRIQPRSAFRQQVLMALHPALPDDDGWTARGGRHKPCREARRSHPIRPAPIAVAVWKFCHGGL